jgi:UDP-N-acetylglucosamine--N-acetylmuramyl-(pentapeptide) pyrophosphoryl-undecaprenol N-acetylglucosamine transferase
MSHHNRGVTIIELVLAIAMVAIISIAMTVIFGSTIRDLLKISTTMVNTNQELIALQRMQQVVRSGTRITEASDQKLTIYAYFSPQDATLSQVTYYYDSSTKTRYVGVPVKDVFHPFSAHDIRRARDAIGVIDVTAPLVVVTGGGLGAKSINEAMVHCGNAVIASGAQVYHVTGKAHYESVAARVPDHPHYQAVPFVFENMHDVLGAADVVVSRASATFLQELAGLAKPAIVIPAAHLGDQVKNAAVYRGVDAAVVLTDQMIAEGDELGRAIISLIHNTQRQKELSHNLHQFAKPYASRDVAMMIMKAYKE